MGCGCNMFKNQDNNEMKNENILNIEGIENDEDKLNSVIKIQRFIHNKLSKKKLLKIKQIQIITVLTKKMNQKYHPMKIVIIPIKIFL